MGCLGDTSDHQSSLKTDLGSHKSAAGGASIQKPPRLGHCKWILSFEEQTLKLNITLQAAGMDPAKEALAPPEQALRTSLQNRAAVFFLVECHRHSRAACQSLAAYCLMKSFIMHASQMVCKTVLREGLGLQAPVIPVIYLADSTNAKYTVTRIL